MNGLEALLGGMGGMERDTKYPTSEELAKIRGEFVHIDGLKAGDKIHWKSEQYKDKTINGANDDGVFEVFRVLPSFLPGADCGSNHAADEPDFTIIAYEGDEKRINEYAMDSRRFERVTE